ncbi:MAG: CtsR family transcriptional regulator [Dialister sp.]|nr:CtsR family transcriptional regulator [Dialister sp.]
MSSSVLSDRIENLILDLLRKQSDEELLISRKDMAEKLECAPSQITYVINTRFSQNRRYLVESRRGTGGYIKISTNQTAPVQSDGKGEKTELDTNEKLLDAIGYNLNGYFQRLRHYDILSDKEYVLVTVMAQILFDYCPADRKKQAAKTLIQRIDWIMKGE